MATMLPRTLLALSLLMSACEEKKTPPLSGERLEKYNSLRKEADGVRDLEGYLPALTAYEQALALCDKSADAKAYSDTEKEIAQIRLILRGFEKMETDYRETLAKNDEQFGEYSPESLGSLRGLVAMLWRQGKRAETEKGLRRLVAAAEVLLARNIPEDPDTESNSRLLSGRLGLLGNFLVETKRYEEAELLIRTSLQLECDYLEKIKAMNSELPFQIDNYRNVLIKMGNTEEQAQERIDKIMNPISKK